MKFSAVSCAIIQTSLTVATVLALPESGSNPSSLSSSSSSSSPSPQQQSMSLDVNDPLLYKRKGPWYPWSCKKTPQHNQCQGAFPIPCGPLACSKTKRACDRLSAGWIMSHAMGSPAAIAIGAGAVITPANPVAGIALMGAGAGGTISGNYFGPKWLEKKMAPCDFSK